MASFWRSPAEIFEITLANAGDADGKQAKTEIHECEKEMRYLRGDWDDAQRLRATHFPSDGESEAVRFHWDAEQRTYDARVAALRESVENIHAGAFQLMMDNAVKGSWFAVGHREAAKGEEIIPCRYWPFLTLDMANATAKGEPGEYRAIRCALWKDVPTDHPIRARVLHANRRQPSSPAELIQEPAPQRSQTKRGRKNAADWDAYEESLRKKIATDGEPDMNNIPGWQKQADVERFVAGLVERDGCKAETSTVRLHVKQMLGRIKVKN